MLNQISTFNFETKQIQTLVKDGELFFHANDLATALGFANPRTALANHVEECDVLKADITSNSQNSKARKTQTVNFVNESGMYALIFGSSKPEAKRFKHWVTSEVLPAIRKTGEYRITLTVEEQKALADTVRSRCKTNGEHYQTVWHNLKQHFGVERYTDILSADFPRAIQFVKTVELPPMIENQPQQHLLPRETVSKVIDYISAISRLVVELGGTLPKIDLDSDQLALAYAQRLLMGRRMTVSFDEAGQPNVRLIPQQSWIVTNENIANIVSDPCGIDKALLPNIIVSATNRLYPTK